MQITLTPNIRDSDMLEISTKAETNDNEYLWGMIHNDFLDSEMRWVIENTGAVNIDLVLSKKQP